MVVVQCVLLLVYWFETLSVTFVRYFLPAYALAPSLLAVSINKLLLPFNLMFFFLPEPDIVIV